MWSITAAAASVHALSLVFQMAVATSAIAVLLGPRDARADTSEQPVPAPTEEPAAIEVHVTGERPATGATSLDRAEARLLPGTFGDPMRAIESLPGVTPTVAGLPYFYVRGAPPGNVGYFLDGIPVPLLYHGLLGPSVIHPALIERVEFHPGGYPARFGRFAGGIVAATTREPEQRVHGEASVRAFDAGGVVEAPFAAGRGFAMVGGRYAYTAPLLSLFAPDLSFAYWDHHARLAYDITPSDRVSVVAFGAHDELTRDRAPAPGESAEEAVDTLFWATFHRVDIRHDHRPSASTHVREAVTFGFDELRYGEMTFYDRSLRGRVEVTHRAEEVTFRAGADFVLDGFEANENLGAVVGPSEREAYDLVLNRGDTTAGAYVELSLLPDPRVELTPGVRIDRYATSSTELREQHAGTQTGTWTTDGARAAIAVEPRLAARFEVSEHVHIVHAFGLAQQPPAFGLPGPPVTDQGLRGGLQSSIQASSGLELELPADVSATVTLFQNAFFDLTEPADATSVAGLTSYARTDGRSAGMELLVRRRLSKRIGGFVSYTLSRSWRTGGRPSAFDRTHVASAAVSYDLGRRWRAGVRLVGCSGIPRPHPARTGLAGLGVLVAPERSDGDARLSPFFRADVRLEKRWVIGASGFVAVVAEVVNATLSREQTISECDTGACKVEEIGPVTMPSVALEGGF